MCHTDHLFTLFIMSFFKQLVWNRLSDDTATVVAKGIYGELILEIWETNIEHRDIVWFVKRNEGDLVHTSMDCFFVLSFSTAIPNWCYRYSKTFNRSVVCIWIFISLPRSYQVLVCFLIACSRSCAFKLAV